MLTQGKTARGFSLIEFSDLYNTACNIQDSSLATECAIWLGVEKADPIILASDAVKLGLIEESPDAVGWLPYEVPEQVEIHTRMHLNQEQAKQLITVLQRFVEHGTISNS